MKHHFLPQHYLRGFTRLGTEDGELYRFDRQRGVIKRTIARKCAKIADLYAARFPQEVGPNLLERMLAEMESTVAPILRRTLTENRLPSGAARSQLLVYIAALCARSPEVRERFVPFAKFSQMSIACAASSADFGRLVSPFTLCQARTTEGCRLAFHSLAMQMRDAERNREAEWPFWLLLGTNLIYHEYMTRRCIDLLLPGQHSPDLVCSDNPARFWFDTGGGVTVPQAPDLNICMALGRRLGILITKRTRGESQELTQEQVVGFNGFAVRQAARFVYSSSSSYEIEIEHGGKLSVENLASSIRNAGSGVATVRIPNG